MEGCLIVLGFIIVLGWLLDIGKPRRRRRRKSIWSYRVKKRKTRPGNATFHGRYANGRVKRPRKHSMG